MTILTKTMKTIIFRQIVKGEIVRQVLKNPAQNHQNAENDQVPKIKVAEVRKGENIVPDVIEIARKIMKKNSEFANSLCSENVQKVQKDALFHMTVTHPRLWNYVNSTFWKDVRKKEKCLYLHKGFPCKYF